MAKRKRRSAPRGASRFKYLPLWILTGVFLFILSAFLTGNKSLFNLYNLYEERNALLEEKERLEAENRRLLEQIEKLQKDMEYIEKVAREKYNFKRENEDIYRIIPDSKSGQED